MKNFYIRFFEHKDDQMPSDSRKLIESDSDPVMDAADLQLLRVLHVEEDIAWWMRGHPSGKVDFVYL